MPLTDALEYISIILLCSKVYKLYKNVHIDFVFIFLNSEAAFTAR
jgi:hypothetical protein